MITIAIGDIHGHQTWQKIVAKDDFDKVVFVGDYFDNLDGISADDQKRNFRDIIAFKKSYPDKVKLLIGNHDFHYFSFAKQSYAGYQPLQKWDYRELLQDALYDKLLQICHVEDRFLFSHAGVTETWCRNNSIDVTDIEQSINDLFLYRPSAFGFTPGPNHDRYGNDFTQPPTWVRPQALLMNGLEQYTHVVGHTVQRMINFISNVILIDTLGTSGQYLKIVDGVAQANKPANTTIHGLH